MHIFIQTFNRTTMIKRLLYKTREESKQHKTQIFMEIFIEN